MNLNNISKKDYDDAQSHFLKVSFSDFSRVYYVLTDINWKFYFCCSSEIVKPRYLRINDLVFIGIDTKIVSLDKKENSILSEIDLISNFFSFEQTENEIFGISELEIFLIDKENGKVLSKYEFEDLILDYQLLLKDYRVKIILEENEYNLSFKDRTLK